MTDDIRILHAACLNQPADDHTRLVLADALRESGDDTLERFGRFLWAGVTLARYRGHEPADEGWFFDAIRERDEAAKGVCEWVAQGLGWGDWPCGWDTDAECPDRVTYSLIPQRNGRGPARSRYADQRRRQLVFEGGMLNTIRLPYAELLEHAGSALHGWPVHRFEPLDVPGMALTVVPPDAANRTAFWRVGGELKLRKYVRPAVEGQPRQELAAITLGAPLIGYHERAVTFETRAALANGIRRAIGTQAINLRASALDRWPRTATADIYEGFEELRPEEAQ